MTSQTKTYIITLPSGVVVTSKSTRTYTHAVVVGTPVAFYEDRIAEANSTNAAAWYQEQIDRAVDGIVWNVPSHAGRLDLAEKAAAEYQRRMPADIVRVVPVEVTA